MEEKAKKKNGKLWIVLTVVAVLLVIGLIMKLTGVSTEPSNGAGSQSDVTSSSEAPTDEGSNEPENSNLENEETEKSYTLEHGELVSTVVNDFGDGPVLVVKAKISSSYSNTATVDQNYYNVEDLVKNQGCADFHEIQYWAVADMADDSEQKVVSFTVDAELIKQIYDGSVPANKLGDYVADLFIHSSLEA